VDLKVADFKMISISGFLYTDSTLSRPLANEQVALATGAKRHSSTILVRNTTSSTGFFVLSTNQLVPGASAQVIQINGNNVLAEISVGSDGSVAGGGNAGNVFPPSAQVNVSICLRARASSRD
jgi:hypothetical protein